MEMQKCPVCKEMQKGKFWCRSCKTVFTCPNPSCDTRITSHVQPRDKPDVSQGDAVTVELPPAACVVLTR